MDTVPSLATFTFVGEGAANVVFELTGVADHPGLDGQLLRVPKDESSGMSYAELQNYWENKVSPLFKPHELVQQRLVKLPQDRGFVKRLNQQLKQIEEKGTRRHDFAGHRFSPQGMKTGMLVEDMRPKAASSSSASPGDGADEDDEEEEEEQGDAGEDDLFTLHEIKPKWLHQSPRAPEGAEQCRNCAREVQRNLKNATRNPVFCPLNLVKATDFPRNQHVAGDIRRQLGLSEAQSDNLQAWLRGSTLLRRLRAAQWDLDHAPEPVVPEHSAESADDDNDGGGSGGVKIKKESGSEDDEKESGSGDNYKDSGSADDVKGSGIAGDDNNIARYCLAMTLRDCSLFLRIPRRPGCAADDVVAKLADLDKKNYAVKREYWEGMEQGLHDKNLYWKDEGSISATLTDCQLPFYKAGKKNVPPEVRKYYRL
ncbi:Inositol-pentakisphosphate 2-kinase [Diaporthe australafricana]|uniref:Inositol-pentakisphosphate 2-kinase n=1 Tax=Diaporthe australafricana TaxID=127596 RepID=A0ABR3VZR8_9PEZI